MVKIKYVYLGNSREVQYVNGMLTSRTTTYYQLHSRISPRNTHCSLTQGIPWPTAYLDRYQKNRIVSRNPRVSRHYNNIDKITFWKLTDYFVKCALPFAEKESQSLAILAVDVTDWLVFTGGRKVSFNRPPPVASGCNRISIRMKRSFMKHGSRWSAVPCFCASPVSCRQLSA